MQKKWRQRQGLFMQTQSTYLKMIIRNRLVRYEKATYEYTFLRMGCNFFLFEFATHQIEILNNLV